MISHAAEQTAHRIKQGMTRADIGASAGQQQAVAGRAALPGRRARRLVRRGAPALDDGLWREDGGWRMEGCGGNGPLFPGPIGLWGAGFDDAMLAGAWSMEMEMEWLATLL